MTDRTEDRVKIAEVEALRRERDEALEARDDAIRERDEAHAALERFIVKWSVAVRAVEWDRERVVPIIQAALAVYRHREWLLWKDGDAEIDVLAEAVFDALGGGGA